MLLNLIPNIFYADRTVGLDLFVDGLGFALLHQDERIAVIARDGAKAILIQDAEYAAKDRPAFAIETDEIDAMHADILARRPDLLHWNLREVTLRPWGAREFGLLDASGVCITIRQW